MSALKRLLGSAIASLALAACSAGGSSPSPGIASSTTAVSTAQAVPNAGTTLALPTVASLPIAGTLIVPGGTLPAGDTVSVTASTSAFAGAPALQSVARSPLAAGATPVTNVLLEYLRVQFSQTSALNGSVNFTFTLPSGSFPPAGPVFVHLLDPTTNTWGAYLGPATVSGAAVTFAAPAQSTTYLQLAPYIYALFEQVGGTLPISVSPVTLQLAGVGSANAGPLVVNEPSYAGAFGESDTCSGIATLSSASAVGPQATYTVVPVAAGSCHAIFTDSNGGSTTATITVTTLGFSVN